MNDAAPLLFFASPLQDADLLYLSGFPAPDPFVFAVLPSGERVLFASDLEFDRARKQSKADQVVRFMEIQERLKAQGARRTDALASAAAWMKEKGFRDLRVPPSFPMGAGRWLQQEGFGLEVLEKSPAPERRRKAAGEVEKVRRVQEATEEATRKGIELIAAAKPGKDGTLYLEGEVLTSERVKSEILKALVERQCFGTGTIVAGGEQACDPHDEGSGPLKAGTFIILDVFPRSLENFYFADMTRTVLKGKASAEQKALFEAVREGQERGISMLRPGAPVREIHLSIKELFAGKGFPTGLIEGRMQGFFHGTGHGVGLEIHEAPRISDCEGTLEEGDLVTVEPGLYYRGLGGARLEDLLWIGPQGVEDLTTFPKILELD